VGFKRFVYLPMLIAALLSIAHQSSAETATLEVLHLPLQEASDAVKSQLSRQGAVTQLPSRRILIIQDDSGHIEHARALLKRLDIAAPQLNVQMELTEQETTDETRLETSGLMLSGGWVRIRANHKEQQDNHQQHFRLQITSGKYGRIEAGHVRAVRPSVRYFLHRYGIADAPDLALVPITAGFDVQARLINKKNVRLHIHPWFERERRETDVQAKIEILPDLGSTNSTLKPPDTHAPMRLNIQPQRPEHIEHIAITNADTELTVKLGEKVTLAAARETARAFGNALLAHYTIVADRSFYLSLTVTQAGY